MTVVLVLLGLALALAMPMMGGSLDSVRREAAARRAASFLGDARMRSATTGKAVRVVFDPESGELQQRLDEEGEPASRTALPAGMTAELEEQGGGVEGPIPLATFTPRGGSSGGTVLLRVPGGPRYRITLSVLTGASRLERVNTPE